LAGDWKDRLGVVYSTNPEFNYKNEGKESEDSLPPSQQDLRVMLDRKKRKGKSVTLVTGFIGSEEDLKALGKVLKSACGTGGTVKNGEIMVQGDFVQKIMGFLSDKGYKVKKSGG